MRNTSICSPKRGPTSEVTLRESPKINTTISLSQWGEIFERNNKSLTSRPGKSLNLAPWGNYSRQTKDGGSCLNLYNSVPDPPLASNYQDGKLVMPHGETNLKRRRNLEEVIKVNVFSPSKDNLLRKGDKMFNYKKNVNVSPLDGKNGTGGAMRMAIGGGSRKAPDMQPEPSRETEQVHALNGDRFIKASKSLMGNLTLNIK
jgi:hypothetical protein